MAYNSDGYIMLDFTEVDFRRTNQTIEGLFKRCVDVIGTNKFILVINANGRTPLPATCSFTNNQYVIDTCIYLFAISSNDNLFIRRNDVPASDIIDDSSISVDKTWSSNKIDSELDTKADASALADYQPLLTAGTNITIDENNVISSTGSAVIDDSVIVNNKVWSSLNTVEQLAPIDTIVNNPAVFNTSLALPLVECSSSFIATQEGTGNPSPTNVRPIVGVDDFTLTANGVDTVIDLDNTRYGCTVNVLTGVMKVEWIKRIFTNPDPLQWAFFDTFDQFYNNGYFSGNDIPMGGKTNLMCETLKPCDTSERASNVGNFIIATNVGGLSLSFPDIHTKEDAIDYVNNNPITFIYKLAIPIEVQLTPLQISTIIGANSIESDTGNIKVSYRHLPIDLI